MNVKTSKDYFGCAVRRARQAQGLSQVQLAERLGVRPGQLCRLELGRSHPSLRTIERLAAALNTTVERLLAGGQDGLAAPQAEPGPVRTERGDYVLVRQGVQEPEMGDAAWKEFLARERDYSRSEDAVRVNSATVLPLTHPFMHDERGAEVLARVMRGELGAGSATFADLPGLLEMHNVRLHVLALPKALQSRSFYEPRRRVLSIVVNARATPERQLYRLAYELAYACLFATDGLVTVKEDSPVAHRLARNFAAAFLMPEEAVRLAVSQTGLTPKRWTMAALCALKPRFNVSAEALALRLEALGLIAPTVRMRLRDDLRAYYRKHPRAMEPKPCLPQFELYGRLKLLKTGQGKESR